MAGMQVDIIHTQTVFMGFVVASDDDTVTVLVSGFVVAGKAFKYADDTVMKVDRARVVEVVR